MNEYKNMHEKYRLIKFKEFFENVFFLYYSQQKKNKNFLTNPFLKIKRIKIMNSLLKREL